MDSSIQQNKGLVLTEKEAASFFDFLTANVVRSKISITAIVVSIRNSSTMREIRDTKKEMEIEAFLHKEIRQTDLLVNLNHPFQWCIVLAHSKEEEAGAFLNRVCDKMMNNNAFCSNEEDCKLFACVMEMRNSDVQFQDVITKGQQVLQGSTGEGQWNIEYVEDYKRIEVEEVKVSIIEENQLFCNILHTSLANMNLDRFRLNIQTFQDGYAFIQSDWHSSSHVHIIVMNDILPRKNGLEVLHMIRSLPNNQRFYIFMMTKRKTEEDMIYAYDHGVDRYIVQPFNIRLFESQIKRTLERLWT
ncbi:response regulator transcription factor [Pontibacillus litoralis]|uniref:Response regulatory domain-containing protein n=1 Tax=Pontibacillus litoralis JSM 072002 TaxID=1385512 RepID=A0A0A5FW15_9BACI|nr:response regulator [Pontibacillus litoralis]KGX84981.1 hypothetical protein N784_11440 [Pontibacillus litoralis JSM 072002]